MKDVQKLFDIYKDRKEFKYNVNNDLFEDPIWIIKDITYEDIYRCILEEKNKYSEWMILRAKEMNTCRNRVGALMSYRSSYKEICERMDIISVYYKEECKYKFQKIMYDIADKLCIDVDSDSSEMLEKLRKEIIRELNLPKDIRIKEALEYIDFYQDRKYLDCYEESPCEECITKHNCNWEAFRRHRISESEAANFALNEFYKDFFD